MDKTFKARYAICMKLVNHKNRALCLQSNPQKGTVSGIELAQVSVGKYCGMRDILENWDEFTSWYKSLPVEKWQSFKTVELSLGDLQSPVLSPRQIFAVGMNYKSHANEIGLALPTTPSIFTKFASSIGAPFCAVKLPNETCDWEVELVAVIKQPVVNGKKIRGRNIAEKDAAAFIAGYMIGQDLSDRTLQFACNPAQFSLGKSHENFAPVGPWLTSADEVQNPQNLALSCRKNGETMQSSNTCHMIFGIHDLIARLSQTVELLPGDLIFTGTPEGVGQGRKPPVYIKSGDEIVSTIEGLGEIRQTFV